LEGGVIGERTRCDQYTRNQREAGDVAAGIGGAVCVPG
jgi:hypothetical protein